MIQLAPLKSSTSRAPGGRRCHIRSLHWGKSIVSASPCRPVVCCWNCVKTVSLFWTVKGYRGSWRPFCWIIPAVFTVFNKTQLAPSISSTSRAPGGRRCHIRSLHWGKSIVSASPCRPVVCCWNWPASWLAVKFWLCTVSLVPSNLRTKICLLSSKLLNLWWLALSLTFFVCFKSTEQWFDLRTSWSSFWRRVSFPSVSVFVYFAYSGITGTVSVSQNYDSISTIDFGTTWCRVARLVVNETVNFF